MTNTVKDVLNQVKGMSQNIVRTAIPILLYGTYTYLTQNNRRHEDRAIAFKQSDISADTSYGRAASAICSSDMDSYYENNALRALKRDESDAYYEAVIAIANSQMSSYYKADAISNL
ncbi:hypothetical protein BRYFOR_08551 [Marvinbryantia formatexigens DSM 14469]|uniref:Uncharacterized protein n=1 Tax=Marvinbryantia formatexigens DSM 14469 TaxID=478749 RepID=C6LIS1_9FIRM|nr:hypothetical protein [Marvinbryantia formatexigens]EET59460.1 hypothetical protein BRYFOR_08551 [Marvinbryantia formatexigens DSM 14469]UWO24061.1 hypothetical protein NQ534_16685 [Marvinbryantia formatexigens DSM 14469]SDG64941.1 hypothetical protein SAMN05660368_02985 [Marvinbryantia formatexigens]